MLIEKIRFEKRDVVMIVADFTAPTVECYAMAWLKLCNFARESSFIYKVKNDRYNKVYVWCKPQHKERVKELLTDIVYYIDGDKIVLVGKVESETKVKMGIPVYEYQSNATSNEDWKEDIESSVGFWAPVEEVW